MKHTLSRRNSDKSPLSEVARNPHGYRTYRDRTYIPCCPYTPPWKAQIDREARDSRPRRRARELCHSCPPCARAYVLRVNGYERREQWGEGEEEGGLGEARVAASTPSLRRPASLLGCSCPFSPLARFKGRRLPGRRVGLTDEGAGKKGPELEGSGSTARFPPRRKWRGAARRAGREERCPYDLNLTMGAMYG